LVPFGKQFFLKKIFVGDLKSEQKKLTIDEKGKHELMLLLMRIITTPQHELMHSKPPALVAVNKSLNI